MSTVALGTGVANQLYLRTNPTPAAIASKGLDAVQTSIFTAPYAALLTGLSDTLEIVISDNILRKIRSTIYFRRAN